MVRKCAGVAFGFALIAALGFAMTHAHLLKTTSASSGFSAPCEPASPVFEAVSALKTVSSSDWIHAAETANASGGVTRSSRIETVERPVFAPTAAFAPLFDRPPPANS